MAKSVAKKEETGMTFSETKPDYIEDSARGQENVGMEDVTIPRLDVLQDLSPQRKKNDPAYIEGAEEGMLFNTVTGELYGESVFFIPTYYKKEWLIWKQQAAGGGFNGAFATEAEASVEYQEKGYDSETFKKDGVTVPTYEIVDTANHFGLLVKDDGSIEEICISMSKSKMKVNRQFNTVVKMAGGDRFSRVYQVSAVEDTNKANQSFFNLKITSKGYAPEDLYHLGEKMYESLSSNERKVAHEVPATEAPSTEGEEY